MSIRVACYVVFAGDEATEWGQQSGVGMGSQWVGMGDGREAEPPLKELQGNDFTDPAESEGLAL